MGLVVPGFFLGFDLRMLVEFAEQVVYIGLAEVLFFRGHVTSRLMSWIGDGKVPLGSAVIFALAHLVSRVSQSGFRYPVRLAEVCLQALVAGLLLGYIDLRSKDIYAGTVLPISGNMYIGRLTDSFSAS